jgi:hypothetical protein
MARLRGHRLESRGAPFTAHSCQTWPCDTIAGINRVNRTGTALQPEADVQVSGHGHGLCECGMTGPHQLSGADRRRWHEEHKATMRQKAAGS